MVVLNKLNAVEILLFMYLFCCLSYLFIFDISTNSWCMLHPKNKSNNNNKHIPSVRACTRCIYDNINFKTKKVCLYHLNIYTKDQE